MTGSRETPRREAAIDLPGRPTPAGLWQLRSTLLRRGVPDEAPIWSLLDEFYHFLNQLKASATAREYSHFASLLDIGAVGGVALQNLLSREDDAALWQSVLVGGLSESLMVMAARQYVKAWEGEMDALYRAAAWNLYRTLWTFSRASQPALSATGRAEHLDSLLAPLQDTEVAGAAKAALIVRLYQLLLLAQLQQLSGQLDL